MLSILSINVYTILVAILVQNMTSTIVPNPSSHSSSVVPTSKHRSKRSFITDNKDTFENSILMENLPENIHQRNVSEATTESTLNHLKHMFSKLLFCKDKKCKRNASSLAALNRNARLTKRSRHDKSEGSQKWNSWTKWSACSVTCGKGREIRWRHCKQNCNEVEIEMEEKTCQLPACPQKLFGILNL